MGILEIVDSKRDTYLTDINFDHYDFSVIMEEVETMGFNFYFCSTPCDGKRQNHMVIMSRIGNDNSFGMVEMRSIVAETFVRAFKGF